MLTHSASGRAGSQEPVVIMLADDGLEVLAEDHGYLLPVGSMRDLLFYGNRVRLIENGRETDRAVARPGPDRRWITFELDGRPYLIHRSRLVWVLRGEIPADQLSCVGDG